MRRRTKDDAQESLQRSVYARDANNQLRKASFLSCTCCDRRERLFEGRVGMSVGKPRNSRLRVGCAVYEIRGLTLKRTWLLLPSHCECENECSVLNGEGKEEMCKAMLEI